MTIAHCKEALGKLLQDQTLRVIALSGDWGTGKTHLWRDIKDTSGDARIKQATKVSLFGVRSIADLKMRFIEEYLQSNGGAAKTIKAVKHYMPGLRAIGKMLSSRFSALDEALLVLAPTVFSKRLLVLDDIERRHRDLNIDEVLGFIDDCAWSRGCTVLLILNSDQLTERDVWETFREKVIDYELRLDTSPEEAFDIALRLQPSRHAARMKPACVICGITNIRVLSKIVRAVNRILEGHQSLSDQTATRMIPSIVLLSAVYYRGMKDTPDIDFVLNFGSTDVRAMREASARQRRREQLTEEDKASARWTTLLTRLDIRGVDEFEPLVVDFLKSGLLDSTNVKAIVDRYTSEELATAAQNNAEKLVQHFIWHPDLSNDELLAEARGLLPEVQLLAPGMVTVLHDVVSQIPEGGGELAVAMVEACVQKLHREAPTIPHHYERLIGALHPTIMDEYDNLAKQSVAKRSLSDVTKSIIEKSGWGDEETAVLRGASAADFASAIRNSTGEDLRLFLVKNIEFYINREQYRTHFGSAMDNFLTACKDLAAKNDRHATVVGGAFARAKISSLLQDDTPA